MDKASILSVTVLMLLFVLGGWLFFGDSRREGIIHPDSAVNDGGGAGEDSAAGSGLSRFAPTSEVGDLEIVRGGEISWWDGDRQLTANLATNLVAKPATAPIKAEEAVVAGDRMQRVVVRGREIAIDEFPVFVSPSGRLMTLPGGVLLVLDEDWDMGDVGQFFVQQGIDFRSVRQELFAPNGFSVHTEPGIPSLDLANRLADEEGVVVSSPNWWREAANR